MAEVSGVVLDQEAYSSQQEEYDLEISQRAVQRQLKQIKRQEANRVQKASQELFKKAAEKVAKKVAVRTASWSIGSTGVGLAVTYIIWSIQAIVGNLMESKWIPKLDWGEFIIWLIVGILLLIILLFLVVLLVVAYAIANPTVGLKILGSELWNRLFS